ncbi:MAG: hypothetical protein ABIM30_00560 [candidate division WOR-3 bacterium]
MKIEIEVCDNGFIVSEEGEDPVKMVVELPEHEYSDVLALCSLFHLLVDMISPGAVSDNKKIRLALGLICDDRSLIKKDPLLKEYRFFKEKK